jgi:hypothetical protein
MPKKKNIPQNNACFFSQLKTGTTDVRLKDQHAVTICQ